jgi:hypothetical protein
VERTDEIHIEHVGPLFEVFLVGQLAKCHRRDAGVGEHDVQPPKLLHSGIERGRQRMEVTNIGDRGDHLAALGLHQRDRLVELFARSHRVAVGGNVGADVHPDDGGAIGGQPYGVAPTLSSGYAGDEGDLAVQRTHRSSLRCVSNSVTPVR